MKVEYQSRCVYCKHKETLTKEQVKEGQRTGVVFCSKCNGPTVIKSVKVKR